MSTVVEADAESENEGKLSDAQNRKDSQQESPTAEKREPSKSKTKSAVDEENPSQDLKKSAEMEKEKLSEDLKKSITRVGVSKKSASPEEPEPSKPGKKSAQADEEISSQDLKKSPEMEKEKLSEVPNKSTRVGVSKKSESPEEPEPSKPSKKSTQVDEDISSEDLKESAEVEKGKLSEDQKKSIARVGVSKKSAFQEEEETSRLSKSKSTKETKISEIPGATQTEEEQPFGVRHSTVSRTALDIIAERTSTTKFSETKPKRVSTVTMSKLSETLLYRKSSRSSLQIETEGLDNDINYSTLQDESLEPEEVDHKRFRRAQSIIEKYKDDRKRIVSLESIESAGSISFESAESEKLAAAEEIEDEELLDEIEEEDEGRISQIADLTKDPSFLDEFDKLEDIGIVDEADTTGMGATGMAFEDIVLQKEGRDVMIPTYEDEVHIYDSDEEILSESDDEAFYYKTKESMADKEEYKEKKLRKDTEKEGKGSSKVTLISFGQREPRESFLSIQDMKDKDADYASDYEFEFHFRWHKRRICAEQQKVVDERKRKCHEESPYVMLKEIKGKVDRLKRKIACDGTEKISEISNEIIEEEEPCKTKTEGYIRKLIAPMVLDAAYYVAKQNLYNNKYVKYAGLLISRKRGTDEPNINEIIQATTKVNEAYSLLITKSKRRSSFSDGFYKSNIFDRLQKLKIKYEKKKNIEKVARKRDELIVKWWLRQYPKSGDVLSKLTNYDILYHPIPKKKLPKANQIRIEDIIRREKLLALVRLQDKVERIQARKASVNNN